MKRNLGSMTLAELDAYLIEIQEKRLDLSVALEYAEKHLSENKLYIEALQEEWNDLIQLYDQILLVRQEKRNGR